VSEQGSHDELLARDGLYAEMYRRELMQAEERIDED
jgi:ABC-type multidrug transport system fused ATPase/permease subunit